MENNRDGMTKNGVFPKVVPVLYFCWWSLILQSDPLWSQMHKDLRRVIEELVSANDPVLVRQQDIPVKITRSGRVILVENVSWMGDGPAVDICADDVSLCSSSGD